MSNTEHTDIEFLISAFAYSFASMNEVFYLRKRDLKVIGVHIFDQALVSECKSEYESGLSKAEERDIKEAIIAQEKNYDTHLHIPRLTKEQRFKIIADFIESTNNYQAQLKANQQVLIESTERYGIEFYKKGIKAGVEMEYLTNGIEEAEFKAQWTTFYRNRTKQIAVEWLEEQNQSLQPKNTLGGILKRKRP